MDSPRFALEIDVGGGGIVQFRDITRINESPDHHEAIGALLNNPPGWFAWLDYGSPGST